MHAVQPSQVVCSASQQPLSEVHLNPVGMRFSMQLEFNLASMTLYTAREWSSELSYEHSCVLLSLRHPHSAVPVPLPPHL